ncbi:DUF3305 domain-containing protein [Vibrio cholerae]|nr:DUF3305 domain-containing protein [Vibrio cholerae]
MTEQTSSESLTDAAQSKTESFWPLACNPEPRSVSRVGWQTTQWMLHGFSLTPEAQSQYVATLHLYRDERTDYRFNLSSQAPKLFLVAEDPIEDQPLKIVQLTASQAVASRYMDSDYLVLSADIPLPMKAWMEGYIGRHEELLEIRRKKRDGAGRSCGN